MKSAQPISIDHMGWFYFFGLFLLGFFLGLSLFTATLVFFLIFWFVAFYFLLIFFFRDFIFVLVRHIMLISKLVPHVRNFKFCQINIITWPPLWSFHFIGIQITFTINISNRLGSKSNSSKPTLNLSITIFTLHHNPDMPTTAYYYNTYATLYSYAS